MPNIGETPLARDCGKPGHSRYVWHSCVSCGKQRWVRLTKGQPQSIKCGRCGSRDRQYQNGKGELNSNWHGDTASPHSGRGRAKRWYALKPCEICGMPSERHHKDSNTLNNDRSNIMFLCRKHHMIADGRISRRNKFGIFCGTVTPKTK